MERNKLPLPTDLNVFLAVARKSSFAAAAEELGQSPAYVSKRIQILETQLKAKLFYRTTRRVVLTEEGETALKWSNQILEDLDDFIEDLSEGQNTPRGSLHICSSFGLGRVHVGPAVAELHALYPQLDIRLELFDRPVDLVLEAFDMEIRVGDDLPEQHVCKLLQENKRILCASREYLNEKGVPKKISDLEKHECLVIKERANTFGGWILSKDGKKPEMFKVEGALSANHGEVVVEWAKAGRGVMLRSVWDIREELISGELVQVLPNYYQSANIWAVYPTRPKQSAKIKACVDFFKSYFDSKNSFLN